MPRPNKTISPAQKAALLECFQFATALVPVALRPQFLLVGGTASIAFSSRLWTDDVDVAASAEAIIAFRQAIAREGSSFTISPCQTIEFDSRQGFRVSLELLQLGGGFVESIAAAEPCYNGFVASLADLILNRAETVVGRGEILVGGGGKTRDADSGTRGGEEGGVVGGCKGVDTVREVTTTSIDDLKIKNA
jgi:hypothetical protein